MIKAESGFDKDKKSSVSISKNGELGCSFSITENEPRIAKITCITPNNISLTKYYINNNKLFISFMFNSRL